MSGVRSQASDSGQKKGPIAGATIQKRLKEGSQGRRCKGPIRQPERLKERCREQRVKVIVSGLFSCRVKEHLPGQNDGSQTAVIGQLQTIADTRLVAWPELP